MKPFYFPLVAAICLLRPSTAKSDDLPEFYLRGEMTDQWNCRDDYKLSHDGNLYSIYLEYLDGEFKISNSDWTINYGSPAGYMYEIAEPMEVMGISNGANYHACDLHDITISFLYDSSNNRSTTLFVTQGRDVPIPPVTDGTSGTLPVLHINVYDESGNFDNEIIDRNLSHKNYFTGQYWLDINGCEWLEEAGAASVGSEESPLPLEIKARGNYTRTGFSKKPFKLKLGKKQSLLGLSKSKHFAILAHADDNYGYLRNFTGFNLGQRIGLPWTPSQQPVEVIINGNYRGLYFLTESIRVEDERVAIAGLDDNETDTTLISGGYLVELDNYDEENQIRMVEKGQAYTPVRDMLRITFDTPEEYSEDQRRFITDQFTKMNDLVGDNSDKLWGYIDLDDAARYYIVEEILSHTEAYHGSTYMYRDRGADQKWHFSPLWDCGNAFNGPTNGFFYDHTLFGNTWIPSFRINDRFNDCVKSTWLWFMSNRFDGLYDDMKTYADHIAEAAKADRKRWQNEPTPDNWAASPVVDNSDMQQRYKAATDHLKSKIDWLKEHFGDYAANVYPEPTRDTTPAAVLPEFISTEQHRLYPDGVFTEEDEWYDMQGLRISIPSTPGLYIRRNAQGAEKIIIR